jgi:hypothetical protein
MNKLRILIALLLFSICGIQADMEREIPDWNVNIQNFQYNASIVSRIYINNELEEGQQNLLGAFYGDECRGLANPANHAVIDYTIPFGNICFLPMVYSNVTSGETITLKYYDASRDYIFDVTETLEFEADMIIGNGMEPFEMNIINTDNEDDEISGIERVSCYPNPFNPMVTISFELADAAEVDLEIFNSKGQKVRSFGGNQSIGSHLYIWNGNDESGMPQANGVYFYRLQTGNREFNGKMVMLK